MITYHVPHGVTAAQAGGQPVLTTPQGGKVAVDEGLLSVWRAADGRSLDEVADCLAGDGWRPTLVRAALACLAEAGLLARVGCEPPEAADRPASRLNAPAELVSVILVGVNSLDWLKRCLPTLAAQTYPALEVVLVDNASTDGTREWMSAHYPVHKVVSTGRRVGLSAAINLAAVQVAGRYLLLLNPDVELATDAVAQLVAAAQAASNCAAVAAKLAFTWAPAFLNGLGNYVRDGSWGSDLGYGHLDLGQFDAMARVPSACFAAALIPRAAWEAVGPADEDLVLYYEDAEWCYRARLLGYDIAAAPRAVVRHAFGSQAPSGVELPLAPAKLRRVVFGRLWLALKLFGGSAQRRMLRNYAREDWINLVAALRRASWAEARAYGSAYADLARKLGALRRAGARLRPRMRRTGASLLADQTAWLPPLARQGLPLLSADVVERHYFPLLLSGRTRPMPEFEGRPARPHVLIASNDLVAAKMAGPGMRYLELARVLAADCDVTLAAPAPIDLDEPGLSFVSYDEGLPGSLPVLAANADVALVSGYMVEKFPALFQSRTRLVVDLYDPFMLENLHFYLGHPLDTQRAANEHATRIVNQLARLGDFFICGSERQRDLWMGVLAANGRVNPRTFQQDPTLRQLIDVVGIGFPNRPLQGGHMLRGVHPAFGPQSRIVLWGGGLWNWLDPLTLLRAWPTVLARHPAARLVFLGTRHPNPALPPHQVVAECLSLAEQMGEKDRSVFFIEWLAYEEREALLSEADIGVVLHPVHIETRYSIRTRVLDYFWARLPVLITEGDVTSEWVRERGLGCVTPPHDVEAVAAALSAMLERSKAELAAAFADLPQDFAWDRVAAPLRRYCLTGRYAPDREDRAAAADPQRGPFAQALYLWSTEGLGPMLRRAANFLRLKLAGY